MRNAWDEDEAGRYTFDRHEAGSTENCMHLGCSQEMHPQSDTRECCWHTLESFQAVAQESGVDEYVASEIARWNGIVRRA